MPELEWGAAMSVPPNSPGSIFGKDKNYMQNIGKKEKF